MKLFLFSIYDKAVKAYLPPIFARHSGEALRSFTDACNDEKTNFYRHAADFTLYRLGEFDDNSGLFESYDPVRVISANEVINTISPFTKEEMVDPIPLGSKRMPM